MVSPAVTETVLVTRVLLCLVLIPVGWRMAVRGGPLDGAAAFGMACMAMLIVSPVTRGHYFMLQWPAVLFVSLWVWNHHGSRKARLGAGIPAALSVMHYVFITFPQMFGPLQTGTLLLGTLGIDRHRPVVCGDGVCSVPIAAPRCTVRRLKKAICKNCN